MAKYTTAAELRRLAPEELVRRAQELRESLFNLRLGVRTGEVHETSKIQVARHELARILTIQREKALGIERQAKAPPSRAEGPAEKA